MKGRNERLKNKRREGGTNERTQGKIKELARGGGKNENIEEGRKGGGGGKNKRGRKREERKKWEERKGEEKKTNSFTDIYNLKQGADRENLRLKNVRLRKHLLMDRSVCAVHPSFQAH